MRLLHLPFPANLVRASVLPGLVLLSLAASAMPGVPPQEPVQEPVQEAAQEAAQERPAAAFTADVKMVLHSVAVLGPDGSPVLGLPETEFKVYEEDEPQDLAIFLTPDANPLDIALVTDSSASLTHYARTVRTAAKSFLMNLAPLDCVYLLPFNDEVGPGTWERGQLMTRRVEGIFMTGGTSLYDALVHGIRVLDRSEPAEPSGTGCGLPAAESGPGMQRRRAVVLLSDGADRNSQRRYDEVLDQARAAAIPIFPVIHGEAHDNDRLRLIMERLAGETGGIVVDAEGPNEIARAFGDVVQLLRASYLVGYRPPAAADGDESPRDRSVRIRSRPGFRPIYRQTYWR